MAQLTTTVLNKMVKETLDAKIQMSFPFNSKTMNLFKKEVVTEDVTNIGRYFDIQVSANESYGSQATEGGAFPAAGVYGDQKALIPYRSQFSSFAFTGDVEDLATNKTLENGLQRNIKDTTKSFDEKQNFFLYGDGSGTIGQIDSISSNAITMLNSTTYAYGARGTRTGMTVNAYDISGAAYRSGDMVVQSVVQSTNIVNVDTAAASIASDDDDTLVFKGSYGYAPQGFTYHINDSGTWLGLSRSTYPTLKATVVDASSASIDWDILELADMKAGNIKGDDAPNFSALIAMHPVQHKNLRAATRALGNVQYQTPITGTGKADLLIKDIAPGGQRVVRDSWCPPSDVFGLQLEDWAIEEVAPRQLYKHNDGSVFIQSLSTSTTYADAKEGRIYARYNVACKNPSRQWRVKKLAFTASEVTTNRL
jgi:hypothetical protein